MIKLRLIWAGKFTAKYPKFATLVCHCGYCLMTASWWWCSRCFQQCPFAFIYIVKKHITIYKGLEENSKKDFIIIQVLIFFLFTTHLSTVVKFTAKHDEFILEGMGSQCKVNSSGWSVYHNLLDALSASLFPLDFSNNFFYILLQTNAIMYNIIFK